MNTIVVVPTYNEAENIRPLLTRILEVCDASILVVDDESSDGTAEIVQSLSDPRVSLLRRKGARGYGSAVRAGLRHALESGADSIAVIDADLSHDPGLLPQLFAALNNHDLVIGSRYIRGGGIDADWAWYRRALSWAGNHAAGLLLRSHASDLTSGFRVYRSAILKKVPPEKVQSESYSFLMEYAVRISRAGGQICEVPMQFVDRKRGKSKMPVSEPLRALWTLFKLSLRR